MADDLLARVQGHLVESTREVLATMAGQADVDFPAQHIASQLPNPDGAVGFIGFTGDHVGGVVVHATDALARQLAAGMLMLDDPSTLAESDVADAFGEIVNMVAGGLKTRLEATGVTFKVSMPRVAFLSDPAPLDFGLTAPFVSLEATVSGEPLEILTTLTPA